MGCDWFHPEGSSRFVKINKEGHCEVPREDRAVWEITATSLRDDVLFDSEERRHDGRHGGAERTVWDPLLEMKRFDYETSEMKQRTITVLLDLPQILGAGQSPYCVGFGDALESHKEDFAGVMRLLQAPAEGRFEGCVAESLQTITTILPGS